MVIERCQQSENGENSLGYRERMCLSPTTVAGGDNAAMAHWIVASQVSQLMGRSPQASDTPLRGGELSSSRVAAFAVLTRLREEFCPWSLIVLETAQPWSITGKTLLQCCVLPEKENRQPVPSYISAGPDVPCPSWPGLQAQLRHIPAATSRKTLISCSVTCIIFFSFFLL